MIMNGEVLTAGVLVSVVLASSVLAVAAAFVRGLILISNWADRSTTWGHSTIHHIMVVADIGMSQTIL